MNTFDVQCRVSVLAAMVLLAGCGGQDSTSPHSLGAADGTPSAAPVTKAPEASAPQAPATMTAPHDRDSIRGDVLATALTQMSVAPADGKPVAVQLHEYDIQRQARVPFPSEAPLFIEQLIGPDTTGRQLGRYVSDLRLFDRDDASFEGIRFQMGLSHAGALPAGNAGNDGAVLTVGKRLAVAIEPNRDEQDPSAAGPFDLQATADLAIAANGRYNKQTFPALMEWKNAASRSAVRLSLSGYEANTSSSQFRICLEASGFAKGQQSIRDRQACSSWQVPDNWQAGQPLIPLDMFSSNEEAVPRFDDEGRLHDTRIRIQYWRTLGQAPFDEAASTDLMPPSAGNPLDRKGVSGALFAAMLDSAARPSVGAIPNEVTNTLHAVAKVDGERLADAPPPQQISVTFSSSSNSFEDGQNAAHAAYSPAAGPLTITHSTYRYGQANLFPRTAIKLRSENETLRGQKTVLLPEQLETELSESITGGSPTSTQTVRLKNSNGKRLGIPRSARVHFDNPVTRWTGELSDKSTVTVSLELHPVANQPGQPPRVDQCWRIQQSGDAAARLHRLSCLRWQVPGNWQYGQALKAVGAYVLDRQGQAADNAAPDAAGQYRYWQSAVAATAP